jgi:signal transduction histidine kinase
MLYSFHEGPGSDRQLAHAPFPYFVVPTHRHWQCVIIVFGAVIGTLVTRHLAQQATDWWLIMLFATGGILVSLTINSWIVGAALNPLRDLGRLVKRLQSGKSAISLKNPDPYTSRMATTMRSLYHELEERNRELQALSERAINAQEEERRAIARSLHDDTGQALSMLLIHLDRIDERIQARPERTQTTNGGCARPGLQRVDGTAPHPFRIAACHPGRPGPGPGDQVVRTHQS